MALERAISNKMLVAGNGRDPKEERGQIITSLAMDWKWKNSRGSAADTISNVVVRTARAQKRSRKRGLCQLIRIHAHERLRGEFGDQVFARRISRKDFSWPAYRWTCFFPAADSIRNQPSARTQSSSNARKFKNRRSVEWFSFRLGDFDWFFPLFCKSLAKMLCGESRNQRD